MLEKMFKDGVPAESLSVAVANPAASPTLAAVPVPDSAPSPCALQPIQDEAVADEKEAGDESTAAEDAAESTAPYQTELAVLCAAAGERLEDVEAMCYFKLQMCPNKTPHDWTQCQYAHDGEVARRRNPSCHSANPCAEYEKTGSCHRGQRCPFAHGVWERGLHPQRYRTSLCSKGERCNRKICFFAHQADQVRKPVKCISSFQHTAFLNFCKISKASAGIAAHAGTDLPAALSAAAAVPTAGKGSKKKKRMQENSSASAKLNLDPACPSFTPVVEPTADSGKETLSLACDAERPTTKAVSPADSDSSSQSANSQTVTGPAPAAAADEEAQAHSEAQEGSKVPSPQGGKVTYTRQNSLENNMAWAAWARSAAVSKSPPPFQAPRVYLSSNGAMSVGGERVELGTTDQEPEHSEKDVTALESFNTSWVDNLVSDEAISKRIEVKPLSATSNNLQWIRWVLNASRDKAGTLGKAREEFVPGAVIQVNEDTQGQGPVEGSLDFAIPPTVEIPSDAEAPGIKDLLEGEAESAPLYATTPLSPTTQPPSGPGAMCGQDSRAVRKPVGLDAEGGFFSRLLDSKADTGANGMPPALFLGIHPSLLAKGVEVTAGKEDE